MNEPNTQLVRLSPETELDALRVPQEAADVEEAPPQVGTGEKDYSEFEYLLKMALEVRHMRQLEIVTYIVAVFVAISSVLTPFIITRYLPLAGRTTSIAVTGNGVSSITTSGGSYTVIATSGGGGNISVSTTSSSTDAERKQKNEERKAKRERKAAEREEKRRQRETRRLERQAAKLERQAEKLRRKAGQMK